LVSKDNFQRAEDIFFHLVEKMPKRSDILTLRSSKLDLRKKKSKCRISSSAHKAYGLENKIGHP
jgi:hypothetical protein